MHLRISLAVMLLAGCPAPENVASSDALFGYWRPDDRADTIFAFSKPEDAEAQFSLSANGLSAQTKPVSGVYVGHQLVQLATFEATAAEFTQTVLLDGATAPGTTIRNRIHAFTRGDSMVLDSTQTDSTHRTWRYFDSCPDATEFGWTSVANDPAFSPNALALGGSLAFDRSGVLYAATGSGRSASCSTVSCNPSFLELGPGCKRVVSATPNMRASAMAVGDDGVLRLFYLSLDGTDATVDRQLRVREKRVGTSEWKDTLLAPSSNANTGSLFIGKDLTGVLLVGGGRVFRPSGDGYQEDAGVKRKTTGAAAFTSVHQLATAPDGRLWFLDDEGVWVERDTQFERVPTPLVPKSISIDPDGALHAIVAEAGLLTYRVRATDGTWTSHVLDSSSTEATIVTHGTKPLRAIVLVPDQTAVSNTATLARPPTPALMTIFDDGHVEAELTGDHSVILPNAGTLHSAVGPNGVIAATLTGSTIALRRRAPYFQSKLTVQVKFEGPGSATVRSSDGRLSCDSDCEVVVETGRALRMTVEPAAGTLATYGCDRPPSSRPAGAPCYFSVVRRPNASTADLPQVFTVKRSATSAGTWQRVAGNGLVTTGFWQNGEWLAVSTLSSGNNAGVSIAGLELPLNGPFESIGLAAVNPSTGQSAYRVFPRGVTLLSAMPTGTGAVDALISTSNSNVMLDGTTLGASQRTQVSLVTVDASNRVASRVLLVDMPNSAPVNVFGQLATDGTAALLVTSGMPLTVLGVPERMAILRAKSDGTRNVTGFAGSFIAAAAHVHVASFDRVAFVANDTSQGTGSSLVGLFSGGVVRTVSLAATGSRVALQRVFAGPDSVLVAATAGTSPVELAGRMVTGSRQLVSLDDSLSVNAVFSPAELTPATHTWGLGLAREGVVFLADGEVYWLDGQLRPLRAAIPFGASKSVSRLVVSNFQINQGVASILTPPGADFDPMMGNGMYVVQLRP